MSNVDNSEVDKFAKLAAHWWDEDSKFKPLHQINPLRLDYIVKKCGSIQGKNILDVGCGGGILAEGLAKLGANVTAIDVAEPSLEVAKLHLLESKLNIDYIKSTAEEFATHNNAKFDIVCCLELLEHVPDPSLTIAACSKMVKTEGHLFFSTINRNLKSYVFAIIGAEYILKILPRGTHDFDKFIKPSELDKSARNSNLQLIDIIGMTYNPCTKVYALDQNDISVNYLSHYQKS